MGISTSTRVLVKKEASYRCEYCGMAEEWEPYFAYHIEHIIAKQHGGTDDRGNLALACHHCNLIKGPNLTSIDPDSGETTLLFHPRKDSWTEHFQRVVDRIEGRTAVGRTTVFLLQMNALHRVELWRVNA